MGAPVAFDPSQPFQTVSTGQSGPAVFDPSKPFEVAAPAAPDVSQGQSLARGALQGASMGFGDEAAAAIDTAVSQVPGVRSLAQMFQSSGLPSLENPALSYAQRRDAYRQANANAQQANPLTYGAGELAGAVATAPAIPTLAGRGLGTAVANAAIQGGTAALGSSSADLTKGEFLQAAKDTGTGAAVGGALGGVLHGVASKIAGGSEDRMMSDVATDTAGKARPKDQLQIRRSMLSGKGDADIAGRDVIMADSTKPIIDLARAGKTSEAIAAIKPQTEALEAMKAVPYKTVNAATGGVPVANITGAIDKRIGELAGSTGTAAERKVLSTVRHDIEETYKGLATIPETKLRETVTGAQRSAIEALGTIAETEHARLAAEGKSVLEGVLKQHLDQAAQLSPSVRNAVQQIRNINKHQSVLLSLKTGLEQRAAKEMLKKQGMGALISHGAGLGAQIHGVGQILGGNVVGGGAMLLAPVASKVAGSAGRMANDSIARLLYQAQRGNPAAVRMLARIRSVPQAAARLAGAASTP